MSSVPDWLESMDERVGVGIASFLFGIIGFLGLFSPEGLGYVDGWYHLARTELLLSDPASFFSQSFEALQFTTLSETYADLHWGYRVLLAPFTLFGVNGFLVGHLFIVTCLGGYLYWSLRQRSPVWAPYLTALVLTTPYWAMRLTMPRSIALGGLLFLVFSDLLLQGRWKALAVFSTVSVWMYTSWIFGVLALGAYIVSSYVAGSGVSWRTVAASCSGFVAGLIVNPFFPSNLVVTWQQVVSFLFVDVAVGTEWKAPTQDMWIELGFAGLVLVLSVFSISPRRLRREELFWFGLVATFGVLSVLSRRSIFYFVLSVALLAASTNLRMGLPKRKLLEALLIVGICLGIIMSVTTVRSDSTYLHRLENCLPAINGGFDDDAVLHNVWWDEFPYLYRHTDKQYTVGLDPRFTALVESRLASSLLPGGERPRVDAFDSLGIDGVVGIRGRPYSFEEPLRESNAAKEVFRDATCYVYRV